jgi:hypothetical protein
MLSFTNSRDRDKPSRSALPVNAEIGPPPLVFCTGAVRQAAEGIAAINHKPVTRFTSDRTAARE